MASRPPASARSRASHRGVVNGQLGWDAVDLGTSVAVLFNVVGLGISEVGAQGAPDVYEEAVPRLDVVARQKSRCRCQRASKD